MKIYQSLCLKEKVHTKNAGNLKAIVHGANLNFGVMNLKITNGQAIHLPGENILRSPDTAHAVNGVLRTRENVKGSHLIGCKDTAHRTGVDQHVLQVEDAALIT
jgi:hypothetical protein